MSVLTCQSCFTFRGSRILVCAAHTDDEVSCAGTLFRAYDEGAADFHVLACSPCYESVPEGYPPNSIEQEFYTSCTKLHALCTILDLPVRRLSEHRQQILDAMIELRASFKPTIVFCPSSTDLHQDHAVVHAEARRAFYDRLLLGWEVPGNQREARTDFFVTFDEDILRKKLALKRLYETQAFRTYADEEALRARAVVRGRQVRALYAEAFETLNVVV